MFETIEKRAGTLPSQLNTLNQGIQKAMEALLQKQKPDGHWCFELEADCTIPAEYILMMHYLGEEIDTVLQEKIAVYIRRRQNEEGGWPLYYGGLTDISCSVKSYYALKLAGDDPEAPHMLKARRAVLQRGGAAASNVFTRIALAMFEQLPWRGVPFIPVEIMLLPRWFPFHLLKVAYWSRTVMVPLFILCTYRAKAQNPQGTGIRELFMKDPWKERKYFPVRSGLNRAILVLERTAFNLQGLIPGFVRKFATRKAMDWFTKRLNGLDGLGAIFPAMVNAYEAMLLRGIPEDDPRVKTAREAIDKLLVIKEDEAYCQPCVSPVWDTLLAACSLEETEEQMPHESLDKAFAWLQEKQLLEEEGDWSLYRPHIPKGGWAFQYNNAYYPDLDDTAFAAFAMERYDRKKYQDNILAAARWIAGMISKNGGFAAFDANNTYYYLNEIPFADHGALLDPPTADVSARCLMLFGKLIPEYPEFREPLKKCMDYLSQEQEEDGSWFGRWGTNYVYGTWSVLIALEAAGVPKDDPRVRKAVHFLLSVQNPDGGWGEDNDTYEPFRMRGQGYSSTAIHTAWALIALLSAGEAHSDAVSQGIAYLLEHQAEDGHWYNKEYNAPGFPRVFYLKYHGYDKYFPIWALGRYRKEIRVAQPQNNGQES